MKKAIVLLSGGQDSTTCLFWAKKNFDEVIAVGFYYGQKHSIELEKAKEICDIADVEYKVFDVVGLLGNSSLTNHELDHNKAHATNKNLPASFTAGRNMLFLTIAAAYGNELGVTDLVTGVCQTDYSGYPDCRRVFVDSMQTSLTLAIGGADIRIHTPLMYITKAETWKLAKDLDCLNIIIDHTITDYNGTLNKNEWGYGSEDNPATALRVKGYYEAKEKGWI